ncbi:hypothetical protein MCEMRE217_00021 [Candidatus Nanopelagicaceae bacterium]
MFKRFRGPLLFLMLLSVTARVFTGASEAQVNFTSLLIDQHIVTHTTIDEHLLLHHSVMENSENASSIPDKHRTYSTYKKYVTPDKSFAVEITRSHDQSLTHERIGNISPAYIHTCIFLPLANSPPVDVSARLLTHTSTTDSSVVSENNFGEIEIDNSAGGLSGLQL